jgi:hypothetical protein
MPGPVAQLIIAIISRAERPARRRLLSPDLGRNEVYFQLAPHGPGVLLQRGQRWGMPVAGVDRPSHLAHPRPGNASRPLLRRLLERPPRGRAQARILPRGAAGRQAARSSATRQCLACSPPEIVGAADLPRVRGVDFFGRVERGKTSKIVHSIHIFTILLLLTGATSGSTKNMAYEITTFILSPIWHLFCVFT